MTVLRLVQTSLFWVVDISPQAQDEDSLENSQLNPKSTNKCSTLKVSLSMNCSYTSRILQTVVARNDHLERTEFDADINMMQIADFENIEWEPVLAGKHSASCFVVRKGLSRKAQLSLQVKRFVSKHPDCILQKAMPYTVVVETWEAFEDMKLFFGGVGAFASFDNVCFQQSVRDRLRFTLDYLKEILEEKERSNWQWILKPSVANKGLDIAIVNNFEDILDATEECSDMREWVLQRYISNPLTIGGHKFHLRVYVLCIGALKVYVYDQILMLLAARRYNPVDTTDIYSHLTNTAKGAEIDDFDEEKYVLLFEKLPDLLLRDHPDKVNNEAAATKIVDNIKTSIDRITGELFKAFENEYTVFSPMQNCFEIFGLDYMVDDNFSVSLLEVNPGPDFKQTGYQLKKVIFNLWKQAITLVAPMGHNEVQKMPSFFDTKGTSFTQVYDKEWSITNIGGGMAFT